MVLQMTHWGHAVVLQYVCIGHRWVASAFIHAAQGFSPPAISSSKGHLLAQRLAAFPLENRNTACLETAPATTQSLTLFTSSHRLGGFAMRGFMIWGLEQLARGAVYAGDSEPSAGSYLRIPKSRTQLPSLYSSSRNCITHFLMIHFLCLATVKHLNCLMSLAMH